MTIIQAIILGLLQGVTELFPISSLGHTVIMPSLLHMQIDQSDPSFLLFIVATHTATALVLLCFFWRDWYSILCGLIRSLKDRSIDDADTYAKIGWLLVVGTVPAGLLGLLFEDTLKILFATPLFASAFLVLNGLLLGCVEYLRRTHRTEMMSEVHGDVRIAHMTWTQTIKIGLMQSLALLPGFSRTGSTLAGGLLIGLSHEEAARFSFLLATPIIAAAAVLKLPDLVSPDISAAAVESIVIGSLVAALGAFISVKYLTRYFRTNTLAPFAYYCVGMGLLALCVLR